MNLFENVNSFLAKQKQEMMKLDEAEGQHAREENGRDFAAKDKVTGRIIGMREMLYENTLQWIVSEADGILFPEMFRLAQPGVLKEDTLSTAISTFTTSLLPAVRRIYSRMLAMELVSVQPLSGPSGYIYWLDHTYGTAVNTNQPTKGDRLDQKVWKDYSNSSEKGTIRDIDFQLKSLAIVAGTKKLKAGWTKEIQQDLASQWKLDIWGELQPQVIDQIGREIDRQILAALLAGAGAGNVDWNANGYLTEDAKYTFMKKQYDETIYNAIADAAVKIYKRKYIQPNWLIMNADTFVRFEKLDRFTADPNLTPDQNSQIGWRYEGILAGKYKVYVDPLFDDNVILLGYRGADWKYACGYYAPYIPVFLSEEYLVDGDFSQRARGAMTRYKAGVVPESDSDPLNYGLATVTITQS